MNQQLDNHLYQKPGLLIFINNWWGQQYFGTKLYLGISLLLGILNMFFDWPLETFSNSPESTIPFQLQRLFFASFVHYYLLDLIMAILCVVKYFKETEQRFGTVVFIIGLLGFGFCIQFVCLILQFGFSYLYSPLYSTPAYGLWNFVAFFIIQESLMTPNGQSQFLFLPMQLKNKYYPIVFITLFTLIQQSLAFISAGIIAIVYFLFQERVIAYQNATIEKIEKSIIFQRFFERPDFKRVTNYQDQLEPSVDHREQLPYVGTPPAKLTIEGSAPFPPSMILQDLQKQLETKEADSEQPMQEEEEKEIEIENTIKQQN